MKHILHACVAAAALALLAGGAMAQTAAPVADAPAAAGTSTVHQGKELGQMKQTPAEKKAAHEKKKTAKNGAKHAAKQQSAAAPKAGKHVEKNGTDAVASEPAKKL
jgi:hypothetical protein